MNQFEKTALKSYMTMKDIKLKPLKIKFDVTTLNMVISFIYKDSV